MTENYKGKKIIVTGGLGFIGQNLVKALVDLGAEVIVVDDYSNSHHDVLEDYLEKVTVHKISVLDSEFFKICNQSIDFIFHLACRTIITCSEDPINDLKVNAESTLRILEHIRRGNMKNLKRFIYTSSASVYGSAEILPVKEDSPKSTMSQYAATKMLGENYTLMYNKMYGTNTSSVRYSNVYGVGQSFKNPYCGVIGKFIHLALNKEPLHVFGDGEQTRDYTYIDDSIQATLLAGIHPKAEGEVYNVGTNREYSVNYLIECIAKRLGCQEILFRPDRDIDNIRRRVIDISKIQQDLRWTPLINLDEGMKRTIEWYKSNI